MQQQSRRPSPERLLSAPGFTSPLWRPTSIFSLHLTPRFEPFEHSASAPGPVRAAPSPRAGLLGSPRWEWHTLSLPRIHPAHGQGRFDRLRISLPSLYACLWPRRATRHHAPDSTDKYHAKTLCWGKRVPNGRCTVTTVRSCSQREPRDSAAEGSQSLPRLTLRGRWRRRAARGPR